MPNTYRIAVLGGDRTRPKSSARGLKVLDAASPSTASNSTCTITTSAASATRSRRHPPRLRPRGATRLRCHLYLGAIGHPDVAPGILEKGLLLRLRFELDQYINLRPVKLYAGVDCPLKDKGPADIDFIVVRENTEGLYSGMGGFQYKGTPQEVSTQVHMTTRHGAERAIRYAFDLTRKRAKMNQLHLVAKTNVLTFVHDTWWRAFNEVGEAGYPEISASTRTSTPPACGS